MSWAREMRAWIVLLPIAILSLAWGVFLLATIGSDGFDPRGRFGVAFVLLGTVLGAIATTLILVQRRRFTNPS